MLLHFNRRVWNFWNALTSPNLICGHYLVSFLEDARILCGFPYTFSSRYFPYFKPSLDGNWMQWLMSSSGTLYLVFINSVEQSHEMAIVQHITIKRLHIYLWCCLQFQKLAHVSDTSPESKTLLLYTSLQFVCLVPILWHWLDSLLLSSHGVSAW